MQECRLMDESPQILYRNYRNLKLDIATESGNFEFNCEFVCPSHSSFRETEEYYHPDPPISRLFVIETGCAEVTMDGICTRLEKGDIAFLPAGHPFQAVYHPGLICKAEHVHLHDGLGFALGPELPGMRKIWKPELFAALIAAFHTQPDFAVHPLIVSAILLLTEPLFRRSAERLNVPPFYRKLMTELNRRPPAALRLNELAREFGLTRSALGKGFRRHFGLAFKEYQKTLLLTKSRRLLLNRELSISQAANELGFEQVFYFFEFFRRASGLTPMEFRKRSGKL